MGSHSDVHPVHFPHEFTEAKPESHLFGVVTPLGFSTVDPSH